MYATPSWAKILSRERRLHSNSRRETVKIHGPQLTGVNDPNLPGQLQYLKWLVTDET
jgi:hypothetical protein